MNEVPAIKSYVKRTGRITAKQKQALTNLWSKYGIDLQQPPRPLEFNKIFSSEAPVILEIGFGMGQSLLEMAKQSPDANFIGIEVHDPGIGHVLAELEKQQMNNVRIFHANAVQVLTEYIPDNSLSKIQIFFPDPWPKKRHHKRRLIQTEFVTLLQKKLIKNGVFHLATDWQNYADHMLAVVSAMPGFYNTAGIGNFSERPMERPLTKFEQRGKKLGHSIYDLIFTK